MTNNLNVIDQILTTAIREGISAPIEKAHTLPRQAFTSQEFARAEAEHVFASNWSALHFVELVNQPGSLTPVELAGIPLVIVSDSNQRIRVFHNITPYDGCLAVIDPTANVDEITTPYHGWKYTLDGKLVATPYWDGTVAGNNRSELGNHPGDLVEVPSAIWGPVLFVNMNGKAGIFEKAAESLNTALSHWDLGNLHIARDSDDTPLLDPEDLKTNWKTHLENWGINVLHEAFVHDIYDQSPEVPRMNEKGIQTFEHYVDDRFMALKFRESDFPLTYGEMPLPPLAVDQTTEHGYFGSYLPNLHFGVFSGLIHFIISLPEGPGRTRTIRAQFYKKEAATGPEFLELRQMLLAGLGEAGKEDARITEAVQKGRTSPAFEHQFYSPRWDQMHYQFSNWVARQFQS